MVAYKYIGFDAQGKKITGEIAAATTEEAERRAANQDITIITLIPITGKKVMDESQANVLKGKKVADADSAVILRNLSVMAETGVPFIDALDACIFSARTPNIKTALEKVKSEVIGGKGLAGAMRTVPFLFPSLVADMIRVAEDGGRLDKALSDAATYLERAAELRKKIINAMLYPIVMMGISMLTVAVLIVFVMPRFAGMFSKMKADIPVTTKALLSMGEFAREKPLITLGIIAGAVIGFKLIMKTTIAQNVVGAILLRTPVLGELLKKLALSRAFQSIATLLSSNVSLMSALEHGSKVSGNKMIREALMKSRETVEHGGSLYDAMKETNAFPPMLLQMVSVGERTGRLSSLLMTTSAAMEEEVDGRLKAMVSIIEPLMIVGMGAIVGTITLSIIAPIYSVVQNVK